MKKLAIIGSGDLGRLIAHHALECDYIPIGFFDDFADFEAVIEGYPVLGKIDTIERCFANGCFDELIVAIGYKYFNFRKGCFDRYQDSIPFANIIHPSSFLDESVVLGVGNVIFPGCVLDRNVRLDNNILLNTAVTIAHDTQIKSHTFVSPRVAIAGFTSIGECCSLGINSTIIDNVEIVDNVVVGAGAVVVKNIDLLGLYVGNPARFIR